MLDFHVFEEGYGFRDQLEIVSEQVDFEHAGEVPGQLVSFLN